MTTIFGKIIKGELPSEKIMENEHLLVIKDIYPSAPIHLLIIPKKEIRNLQAMQPEDLFLVEEVVKAAQFLAKKYDVEEGYRLLTNNGKEGGQEIFHLHFHFLAGKELRGL